MKPSISENGIVIIDGVLDAEDCSLLIQAFEESPTKQQIPKTKVRMGTFDRLWLPHWRTIFDDVVKPATAKAIYTWMSTLDPSSLEEGWINFGWYISKYDVGDRCWPHFDGILLNEEEGRQYLALAGISVNLNMPPNDDGALIFTNQNINVNCRVGRATVFPTCYTHPHRIEPVKFPRYVLLGWMYYARPITSNPSEPLGRGEFYLHYPYDTEEL